MENNGNGKGTENREPNAKQDRGGKAHKGVYSHRFEPVYKYDGKEYVTMDFRFADLTGDDMIKVEIEMQDENVFAMATEISKTQQSKLAARAAGVGADVITSMPLRDFNKITNEVRAFLLSTG